MHIKIEDIFAHYSVKDLLPARVGVLMVFESPHREEVKAGYPLAGASGIAVTETLKTALDLDDDCMPFGQIVCRQLEEMGIGIMNASSIPLQSGPYKENEDFTEKFEHLLKQVRDKQRFDVRGLSFKGRNDANSLIRVLRDDFVLRLHGASITADTEVILCGGFAKNMWCAGDPRQSWRVLKIPHPSGGQWHLPKYTHKILALKKVAKTWKERGYSKHLT